MSDTNLLKKVSGQLSYVPLANYTANKASLVEFDGTNHEAVITSFNALFTLERTGYLTDYSYAFGGENEETVYILGCGNNIALDTIDRITSMTATIASLNNYGFISSVINGNYVAIVGSTENVLAESLSWNVGIPVKLANKNHNNKQITNLVITDDTSPVPATLLLNTDYTVYVQDGYTYVVPLVAYTGVVADYDFTTSSSDIMAVENKTITVPRTAYKFVSCVYRNEEDLVTPFRRDIIYFTECKLTGEVTERYYKQGDTFEGSEVGFIANTGIAFKQTLKGATVGDVAV